MGISIFAKKPCVSHRTGNLLRGSSLIRGNQIAEYIGAKLNPAKDYENDVCIFVKPNNTLGVPYISNGIKDGQYVDIVDGILRDDLVKRTGINIIACSQSSYLGLKQLPHKVVLIPQQHCNFKRERRDRKEITTVGVISARRTFELALEDVASALKEIGMEFITDFAYRTREGIVDFYKKIDIQLTWCNQNRALKNPLRIINAASFGIPTVGLPQKGYCEADGYYIPTRKFSGLVEEVKKFKDQCYYQEYSDKIFDWAEEYHISRIAPLYLQL